MKSWSFGFTLVELMVAVSVIAILSSVVYVNFGGSTAQARDAQRKSDLTLMQNAIEMYKQENGRYPRACPTDASPTGVGWSGQIGTSFECTDGGAQYIEGLAPKYIKALPVDPKLNATTPANSGYVYRVNDTGTVYKIVAWNTVESEELTNFSDFTSCDYQADYDGIDGDGSDITIDCSLTDLPQEWNNKCGLGVCNMINTHTTCNAGLTNYVRIFSASHAECNLFNIDNSYAVWGGYGNPSDIGGNNTPPRKVECLTERIICDMP